MGVSGDGWLSGTGNGNNKAVRIKEDNFLYSAKPTTSNTTTGAPPIQLRPKTGYICGGVL